MNRYGCFLAFLLLIPAALPAQQFSLQPGESMEREIVTGETHEYRWTSSAGEFAHFVARQKENDLAMVITIRSSDAATIAEIYSPVSPPIPVPISVLPQLSGEYKLEIRSLEKDREPRRYEISFRELREATQQDTIRVNAEKAMLEAERLRGTGTKDLIIKSMEFYQQALPSYRELKDATGEAIVLAGLGRSHDALGEKKKAYDLFQQAVVIQRRIQNRSGEANILNYMGLVHDFLGERPDALKFLNQALETARQAQDRRAEALALNNLGLVNHNIGDSQKALEYYGQALPLHRAIKNLRGESTTLNNMGTVYLSIGEKQKALECLQKSLEVRRLIGDPAPIAIGLNNIGALYYSIDDFQKALEYYHQALRPYKEAGDPAGEAIPLHNIARVHQSVGEYQEALRFFKLALHLQRSVRYRAGEGVILSHIGQVYSLIGDQPKALNTFQEALEIHRETKNSSGEAMVLTNLGSVYESLGHKQKALEYFQNALALRRTAQDRHGEGIALNQIARVQLSLGDAQTALDLCEKALPLMTSSGSRRGEALTLDCLGSVKASLGEPQRAVELFDQASAIFHSVGDLRGEATSQQNASRIELNRANFVEAKRRLESVLTIAESLRSKMSSPDLRSLYFASIRDSYELYIDALMQLHRGDPSLDLHAAALHAAEKAKARTLLEMLAEAGVDFRQGVSIDLLRKENHLLKVLNAKAERQMRLLGEREKTKDLMTLAKEIDALTSQHRDLLAEIRSASPFYAAITHPQPLNVQEIQHQILGPDSVLLEFSLGEKRSYLWVVSQNHLESFVLPGRDDIEKTARKYYDVIRSNGDLKEIARAGTKLRRQLFSNVKFPQQKRLLIVPEGVLQYVPFSALPNLEQEIVILPSASVLATLRRERTKGTKTLAVFADPVFEKEDPRVAETGNASTEPMENEALLRSAEDFGIAGKVIFSRLIGTRREAAGMTSLVAPDQRREALDFEASKALATSDEISKYRIVHFATHGLLNSRHPELSGLVLSLVNEKGEAQDGFLRLQEIYNLRLGAELVVLSACQTALGQEMKGEGLVGLTRGFMYAGASRVVASLWKVDDKATSQMMKYFYTAMLGSQRMRPAAAMRAAQKTLRNQKRFESPYYWAAFVLQGEWR